MSRQALDFDFQCIVVMMIFGVAMVVGAVGVALINTKATLETYIDYIHQRDLCEQDERLYGGTCQLELDDDNTYNWYYTPNGD